MSLKLKLKQWEISLLEWELAHPQEESVHVSRTRKWTSTGLGPEVYAAEQRYWTRKKLVAKQKMLAQRLAYLKRHHYLERVKEADHTFEKLTARGKFEVLRLQFALHMQAQRHKPWNGKFYLVVFDIPETMRRYRDFFRKLLKSNGFKFLQLSVWMTRYDPRPALDDIVRYLKLQIHYELMEIDCGGCSPRVQRKIR
ncbi:CRISPR-associated endonuclease Cas2 [Candidatus Uhrbacteria bacterium RIFCSPLOWO2_12_FULL_47_10]|nr:MAG: CRISPR-associated endonuclease Cas2 [Candidatus Uhrbacteria bacterium RIFCSPLOWO2_02_FULL_46_25]OGL93214.1 MAG: CRISPR-associated endonuclease Cas2 [Candidatus Uhrbacteria bacterium RIFCSPLOWO2_12_FULL_47_10]